MKALIIVDPQNSFCKGGSLEVPDADNIIPLINKLTKNPKYDLVIITQDWHPENHKSFASQHPGSNIFDIIDLNGIKQTLWPEHCIQNTDGANFHKDLNLNINNLYIFKKGMDKEIDSYSAFYENNHITSTGLTKFLKSRNVTDIDIVGLSLEYCVLYTAIDSINNGFNTNVLLRACRGIATDLNPYIIKMKNLGIKVLKNIRWS
jgi:nicotinamidase/pyrazinamidase